MRKIPLIFPTLQLGSRNSNDFRVERELGDYLRTPIILQMEKLRPREVR